MKTFTVLEFSGIPVVDREQLQNWWEGFYDKQHESYLVDAENADAAKRLVAQQIFIDANRGADGAWNIISTAFEGLRALAFSDDADVIDYLGSLDGSTAIAIFDRYTWDAFVNESIVFGDLDPADQELFTTFEVENLQRLFVDEMKSHLVVVPITKRIKHCE